MTKVFIDGSEGTTGLRIKERLAARKDIELVTLPDELRKDASARAVQLNSCDFSFLCLPDAAAVEAVSLVESKTARIIDASTAHRVNDAWAYGIPELSKAQREKIKTSNRVANPGCYATAFVSLLAPLTSAGIVSPDAAISCHAISGYSGAGKKGIAQYEDANRNPHLDSPRAYALTGVHKHQPEMQKFGGLNFPPSFAPIIADFYAGMTVFVQIQTRTLAKKSTIKNVEDVYKAHYGDSKIVNFVENPHDFMAANALAGKDNLEIYVRGNDDSLLLCARLDNLGKGASGAAVQNLNIMMGVPEETGLELA